MKDKYDRTIDYMRISITDRCNLRCRYCMPEGIEKLPMQNILSYEDILEIAKAAVSLGIRKFKVTGGEPLARLGCAELIGMLKNIPGTQVVTMTTNGVLLPKYLPALLEKGLDAVNISLDTMKRESYRQITGRDAFYETLAGIEAAYEAGLRVKINCVLQKGVNEQEWMALLSLAKDRNIDVRFIEMMPIGYGKESRGVNNEELLSTMRETFGEVISDQSLHGNGPAVYYRIPGYIGSVGMISAMHGKFCDSCNRIRLTAQGKVKPCLCYGRTVDLWHALRREPDARVYEKVFMPDGSEMEIDGLLREKLQEAIALKPQAHCFEKLEEMTEDRAMHQIGG